jgi:xanthine dehydrogenase/oxidase
MTVLSSTQNPDTIHGAVTAALGLTSNEVDVQIRRVGGGYGGKGPRSRWAAANAAVSSAKVGRPVKLTTPREVDSALFGHDSPLSGEYRLAIGTGKDADGSPDPQSLGRLMGMQAQLYVDAGSTADCTPIVLDCVQLRFDNAYMIPNYRTSGRVCLTNTTSNTSFRSLDAISGITILEDALEAAAHELGILPEDVRAKNLYRLGDTTPYGEVLDYYYLPDVWEYASAQANFDDRLAAVETFNREHRWVKRGISMIPIKYGMGFNAAFLERGDALVDIYDGDGTVIVRHGGVEIGQGLNTQVVQLVARELNVPMHLVRTAVTSTAVIPNPESTGASTGAAFNGGAAMRAARVLRRRLESFALGQLTAKGRQWCADNHIDFWNFDAGWQAQVGTGADQHLMWTSVVRLANLARIDLSAQEQDDEKGGTAADTGLLNDQGKDPGAQNFVGYTFSVACSEVEVDILTGEVEITRSDLVYDMGKSINPATDVGQIEGGFMQGVGRVLLEDVVTQMTGPNQGQNNTPNTWGYKIPASTTVPRELNVDLYPRANSSEVPENPNLLMSAKEVGEPPLCMATTVYFALKHAILDSRVERGKPGWFRLDMPSTVQRVREACEVEADELCLEPPAAGPDTADSAIARTRLSLARQTSW